MTAPSYTTPCLETTPLRSLTEYRLELRGRWLNLLLRQLEAEAAGDDDIAADCLRRIGDIEERLRSIDGAML